MGPPGTWPILLCFFITKRPSAPGGRSFRVLCGDDAAPRKQRGPISSRRAADRRPCPHVLRRFRRGGLSPPAPTRAAPLFVWGATSSSQSPHRSKRPGGHFSLRSLARPPPTRPASLGSRGAPDLRARHSSPWTGELSGSAGLRGVNRGEGTLRGRERRYDGERSREKAKAGLRGSFPGGPYPKSSVVLSKTRGRSRQRARSNPPSPAPTAGSAVPPPAGPGPPPGRPGAPGCPRQR